MDGRSEDGVAAAASLLALLTALLDSVLAAALAVTLLAAAGAWKVWRHHST